MTAALLVLLAAQAGDPVREAVRRGLEHLKTASGDDAWVVWTLVSADVPQTDAAFKERFDRVLSAPLAATRQAALRAMILEQLDPHKYRAALRHCAQFFADNQAADGLWGEGGPIEPLEVEPVDPPPGRPAPRAFGARPKPVVTYPVKARRAGPAAGDVENARWAVEGLFACRGAGALFPEDLLARATEAWRAEGREAGDVARALATLRHLQGRDFRKDPDVARAAERLAVAETPADPWALYERQRTSCRLGRDFIADPAAAERALVARQKPDGSWGGVRETCAAVLVLYRRDLQAPRPK